MEVMQTLRGITQLGRLAGGALQEWWTTGTVFIPLGKGFVEDPYPYFRKLRERDPIHRSPGADGWILTRHRDLKAILADPRFSSDPRTFEGYARRQQEDLRRGLIDADNSQPKDPVFTMLTSDPPEHTRLRNLVSKAFTPRAVEGLRQRVEALVDEALDSVAESGEMELVRDLAVPLPVIVIAEMLGIPSEDREQFKRWSSDFADVLGRFDVNKALKAKRSGKEFGAYISRIAEDRRREPKGDLISGLVTAEDRGDQLQDDEIAATCALILTAGNETTTNLIANGMLALLRHPDQLDILRSQPDGIETVVEELLRYDSPIQGASRNVLEDLDYEGHHFERGQQILLLIGAANRDPEVFADPDGLDVKRVENPQLAFGFGRHLCLGAQLARLEAQVAIAALIARFPDLRLASDEIERNGHIVLRGVKALPLHL